MIKKLAFVALAIFTINTAFSQITEIGLASFYADKFDGRITASGDVFDQTKMTAAHRTLPFGSKVKVTNLVNKKTITVVINDRGPFVNDRVIDLSKAGAKQLGFVSKGVVKVKMVVLSIPNSKVNTSVKTKPSEPQKTLITTSTIATNNVTQKPEVEYYKIKSELLNPKGFGIQIASYQEAANLIKRCDLVKQKISKDVIVQVAETNGNKVYRIIIGTFIDKSEAIKYNEEIQNSFSGSFIVAF